MADVRNRLLVIGLQGWLGRLSAMTVARCLAAVTALLCVLVTLQPFPDLRIADLAGAASGRMAATYLCFAALAALAVLLSATASAKAFRTLLSPLHLCLIGWMIVNIALSESREVSLQRFVLTVSCTALAVTMPLLPPTQKAFNQCLTAAALVLLALCYLGVFLAPDYAIHTANDAAEPFLAGDWRGTFAHKNVASPVMSILVYLGIYLTFTGAFLSGPVILVLAGIFLGFTEGKTASVLCLVVYALASLAATVKSLWLKRIICLAPLLVANLLTVGSVMSDELAKLTRLLPVDPTFTGRNDVWEFALAAVREKPIIGHGYAVFWDNVASRPTAAGSEWTVTAAHSHNSYLELAVTIGLPGLALAILIFVLAPLDNFQRIQAGNHHGPLARFFLAVWLFGLYYGITETFLLDRQNPTWFMFALAAAGLHFLARFPVRS
jgi:O-antigen ligase